jgi:hypothetical protein
MTVAFRDVEQLKNSRLFIRQQTCAASAHPPAWLNSLIIPRHARDVHRHPVGQKQTAAP